jgi:glucosamine 6-phosphate synthetase-like amidotransferase/phosphosugar isomerase protein
MCGIFGSTDLERYKTLYELNKDRGSFAYGGLYVHGQQGDTIQKTEGNSVQLSHAVGEKYYMGHTQGPTSAQREWTWDTSHPFRFEHWHIAHNGVLSNSKELATEYEVDSLVDSAIIPKLLSIKELDSKDEVNAIEQACSELKGTFTCWMYNEVSEEAYLVRCGSTLFANTEGEFSSTNPGDMNALKEGMVYRIDYENRYIHETQNFKTSSPFFIL